MSSIVPPNLAQPFWVEQYMAIAMFTCCSMLNEMFKESVITAEGQRKKRQSLRHRRNIWFFYQSLRNVMCTLGYQESEYNSKFLPLMVSTIQSIHFKYDSIQKEPIHLLPVLI